MASKQFIAIYYCARWDGGKQKELRKQGQDYFS